MILALKLCGSKRLPLLLLCAALIVSLGIMFARSRAAETMGNAGQKYTLVIDPGHGGIDGGAAGVDGSRESDINLAVALKLRAVAELYGQDNLMLRQEDVSLSPAGAYSEHEDLVTRAELVNAAVNPVLISVHQNCFPTGQPSGAQVIYSSGDGSEALGKLMHANLIGALDSSNRRVAEPASKKLFLLSHVSCPAILVECGFMSNFSDINKLNDSEYQSSLAAVMFASFLQFQFELYHT